MSALFPEDAATLDVGDLASIAYSTLRPVDAAGRDWWVTIYTRPIANEGWYHARYISNFDAHTVENAWVRYTTSGPSGAVPALTFRAQAANGSPTGPALSLAELYALDSQPILAITVQTASGWSDFTGAVDGLEVTLTNGRVGKVDFGDGIALLVAPHQVPDEELPRVNLGDAAPAFGPSSWRGPAAGPGNKSNWHARHAADGDALSALFPDEAAGFKVSDLASISYATKRPSGVPGQDWWIQIYTRTTGTNDAASWYHARFINNFDEHTESDAWTRYSTRRGMTFDDLLLRAIASGHGNELIEMISVQTASNWNGFDGSLDGLEIVHKNGRVGRVNFVGCAAGDYPEGNSCRPCQPSSAITHCEDIACIGPDIAQHTCVDCAFGYQPDPATGLCADIDECLIATDTCGANTDCINDEPSLSAPSRDIPRSAIGFSGDP